MTLQEFKNARTALEIAINRLVNDFQKETGVEVASVNVQQRTQTMSEVYGDKVCTVLTTI